ncbi:glycosyltransferase [Microbacterium sp. CR_7]|uniref:glycosyltransferase n=1 Tax=Microbacterium sp. CR_7 TaxID=3055792 RepID=UPI0035C17BFE
MHAIWAIISTFRPDEDFLNSYDSIAAQVERVVVVDDASGADYVAVLSAIADRGAIVERLPQNSGIAAALNRGYEIAVAGGASRILSFDQDSHIDPGYVRSVDAALDHAVARGHRVGLVVPEYFADVRQAHARLDDGTLLARNIIQSGMLVEAAVLEDVGMMRSDFFIDLVDTEFELRVRASGYRTIAAPGAALAHQLGRQYARMLFGRPLSLPGLPAVTTFSTPFRYFYRVRNRIVLNRLHARSAPGQILRDTLIDVLHFANAAVVARPRATFAAVLRAGVNAGLRRRMGRMPDSLAVRAATVSWNAPLVEGGGVLDRAQGAADEG